MAWLRAQQMDAALRDALTNPESGEVKYLRKRLTDQKVQVQPADVAAWVKARLMEPAPIPSPGPGPKPGPAPSHEPAYWLVPAGSRPDHSAEESVKRWLARGMWGMWESTPGRKALRAGDWLALYAVGAGVIAYGRVTAPADVLLDEHELPEPQDKPTYKVPLADVEWVKPPLVIDSAVRASLDVFKDRNPDMTEHSLRSAW